MGGSKFALYLYRKVSIDIGTYGRIVRTYLSE